MSLTLQALLWCVWQGGTRCSVLCGHWRYAHINGVRGDGVNPGLLGMSGTVNEDTVRLLLTRLLRRWPGGKWLPGLPDEAALLVSG